MEDAALAVVNEQTGASFPTSRQLAAHWLKGRVRRTVSTTDLYCAELVAMTYQRMGLLGDERPVNWYDPGRFWSGDRLELDGAELGPEIAVEVPPPTPTPEEPVTRPSPHRGPDRDGPAVAATAPLHPAPPTTRP